MNHPTNAYITASTVVKNNTTKPSTVKAIPNAKTSLREKSPRNRRAIFRSFHYGINIDIVPIIQDESPAITNVLPIIVSKNTFQYAVKEAFAKYSANQNPVKTGKTLAINTGALKSDLRSR